MGPWWAPGAVQCGLGPVTLSVTWGYGSVTRVRSPTISDVTHGFGSSVGWGSPTSREGEPTVDARILSICANDACGGSLSSFLFPVVPVSQSPASPPCLARLFCDLIPSRFQPVPCPVFCPFQILFWRSLLSRFSTRVQPVAQPTHMSVIGASVLAAALALSPTPHVASGARCHPSFAPRTLVTKTAATPLLAGQPLAVRWQRAGGPPLLSAANGAAGRGLVRSAVVGGAFAALAVAGRGGRLGLLLLQTLAVCWPAWSAVRLWRNGKRRAALTLALSAAARRFCSRWWQYLTIPLFAGAVGWLTNKVAVDMIFYPVEFGGLRLRTYPNQPLGWIGWQGIVPAKAGEMAARITDLVTNKLVDVEVVFRRLSPGKLASLLSPGAAAAQS